MSEVSIVDLFNVAELQTLQDAFCEATGVASVITTPEGAPITHPSNFCRLCKDVIRKTEKGLANCFWSDSVIGRHSPGGPTIQRCLSGGLWDAGASISVGGKHVANWLIGQVKNEYVDERKMIDYAREIGADEVEFCKALRDVPVMPLERFQNIARMVFLLANELSQKAYQNYRQAQLMAELKRTEAELRQSNWTLETLFQSSPTAIVAIDPQGRVTAWNRASEQMFGWTVQEVHGLPLPIIPADRADEYRDEQEAVLRGEVPGDKEAVFQRKDGTLLDTSLSVAPLRDAEGRIIGVLAAFANLTERKRLEAQLLQSQKLESVGRLAGGVAHDFNNLLTVINCHTDLLLSNENEPGSSAGLREIRKAGEHASTLTRQLLAFSRRQLLQSTVVNLREVAEDMQGMLQRLLGEDIQLLVIAEQEIGLVKADPGQMQQVIMNLAVNARDAMPRGGRLVIQLKNLDLDSQYADAHAQVTPGPYVLLSVSDTGIGMMEDMQKHIFEPFFTTKEAGKGTGLGLSMVWGIVKQSGGHIWVYSEREKGTTFKIYLPRFEAPVVLERLQEKATAPCGTETILLVEDQEQLRLLSSRILRDHGYRVFEAANGEEALLLCQVKDAPIHLVLTDVVMPGMTGVELGRHLNASHPEMKVLYMSGYTDDVVCREGALEPSAAYLEKPFTPEGLVTKIREVLGDSAIGQKLTA